MKKTSVLIPVILVLCLIALALLVSRAIVASKHGQTASEDSTKISDNPKVDGSHSLEITDGQVSDTSGKDLQLQRFQDLEVANGPDSGVTASGNNRAEFLVIAGTFRQEMNARRRVSDLMKAGFTRTEMKNFDRGTYAVALVNRSPQYAAAREIADRVRAAGFEATVYRRRY